MSWQEIVQRRIQQHANGEYTVRELFPLLASLTPPDGAAELVQLIPGELSESFGDWVKAYPLEGGIKIRDGEDLPQLVIERLKSEVSRVACQRRTVDQKDR